MNFKFKKIYLYKYFKMKATLEFNIEDYDDYMLFKRHVKSTDMALAIFELIFNTRKTMEYNIHKKITEFNNNLENNLKITNDLIEDISSLCVDEYQEKINNIINEYNINIDEIIN